MSKSVLHSFDIGPCLDQLGGVGMSQAMMAEGDAKFVIDGSVTGVERICIDQLAVVIPADEVADIFFLYIAFLHWH